MSLCRDGQGYPCPTPAAGWIVSPEGRRIGASCKAHATACITEYDEELGETWTFEPRPVDPNTGDLI